MVRTTRASRQEHVKEGLARVLDFDNFGEEEELQTISETLGDTTCQDSGSHHEQPKICEGGETEDKEEKHNRQVILPEHVCPSQFSCRDYYVIENLHIE